MSFLEEFQANLDSLPRTLQKKYSLLRDLDKSLQDIQKQNEQRCEQEIEDIRRGVKSGNITPDTSLIRFSDEALDEQKHSIRIADEKVALAVQAYDLVDTHIQQLDQYLKKFDEELRRERENAATTGVPATGQDGSTKSGRGNESGRGWRKKFSFMTAASNIVGRKAKKQFLSFSGELKEAIETLILCYLDYDYCRTRQASVTAAAAAPEAQTTANPAGMDLDLPVDPNEPTYCFCNQVSYGEMVACDNPNCKIEWFHFGCVGLKEQPKGKWYCSDCASTRGRRKGK